MDNPSLRIPSEEEHKFNILAYKQAKEEHEELLIAQNRKIRRIGFFLWCLMQPIVFFIPRDYLFVYSFFISIILASILTNIDFITDILSFGKLSALKQQAEEANRQEKFQYSNLEAFEKPLCEYNQNQLSEFFEEKLFRKRSGNQQFEDDLLEFSNMVDAQSSINRNLITRHVRLREHEEYIAKRMAHKTFSESRSQKVIATSQRLKYLPEPLDRASREMVAPEERYRTARKIDNWDEINQKRRINGQKGEEIVLALEQDFLESVGRKDLADRIRHVSIEDGDGLGYDILSFFKDGREKYIEVKSTTSFTQKTYLISRNELSFLREHLDDAFVCRVVISDEEPRYEMTSGRTVTTGELIPTQYLVHMQ